MTYKMFIDDKRFPVDDSWVIVRSSEEAIQYVKDNGMPIYISFDHDLGGDDTAIKFIWWMIDSFIDEEINISHDFNFYVHSQNPIGAENIRKLMTGFLKSEVYRKE
jgi:hypothetical protein